MSDVGVLNDFDALSLDLDGKVKLLDRVCNELVRTGVKFAKISGEYNQLKAEMDVLKNAKSALQSSIKAERLEM